MGIEDGTTEYQLSRPLEYRVDGGAAFAEVVLLREPGMDHVKHYLKLKQMLMRAQMELAKQAGEINKLRDSIGEEIKPLIDDAERIEAEANDMSEAISLALQAAQNVDIGVFIETFEAMATLPARKPIALVDGRQAMTQALWASLKPDDAFGMAVRWCSFFAMPSEGGDKTISGPQSGYVTGRTAA